MDDLLIELAEERAEREGIDIDDLTDRQREDLYDRVMKGRHGGFKEGVKP